MRPYDLPEFYMPYPARLNPHLAGARAHSKAWAREVGILGPARGGAAWGERDFDARDCALLCSYAHPDCPGVELNLITDWYVWAFYFDDHVLYKLAGDLAGARASLDRLLALMPLGPAGPGPAPKNAVERGLADLWGRTAPSAPSAWRARFRESTRRLLRGPLWGLTNARKGRVANPIESIEMWREAGGGPWSADLVERAAGAELPPELTFERPMRVLKDTFCDGARLRSDLFSYRREAEGGGANFVLAVERLLGCGAQAAADITNDLLTSRLHQFENTALVELPVMFEERAVAPGARAEVLKYVKGLQDWQAGGHEWHLQTGAGADGARAGGRFALGPTGLGVSAARVFDVPRDRKRPGGVKSPARAREEASCGFDLPAFYMPFAARTNPHLSAARRAAKAWALEMGMIGPEGAALWAEPHFDGMDLALFAANTHPGLSREGLDHVTLWDVWAFSVDDYFYQAFKRPRDLAGAKAFVRRLPLFMPPEGAAAPPPTNVVERGLADVWARTAGAMPEGLRRAFPGAAVDYAAGGVWELTNVLQDRLPDPVDYVEMRRRTAGTGLSTALARYAAGADLLPEAFESRAMRALTAAFADSVDFRNDIFSYEKEIAREDEINNAVLVVRRFLDVGLQRAVELTNELLTARLREFESIAAEGLPAMFDELGLDAPARGRVLDYVRRLEQWAAGDLQWYLNTARYKAPAPRLPVGPAGLGVSAAGLSARLRASPERAGAGWPARL